jgi:hypothetical protein
VMKQSNALMSFNKKLLLKVETEDYGDSSTIDYMGDPLDDDFESWDRKWRLECSTLVARQCLFFLPLI